MEHEADFKTLPSIDDADIYPSGFTAMTVDPELFDAVDVGMWYRATITMDGGGSVKSSAFRFVRKRIDATLIDRKISSDVLVSRVNSPGTKGGTSSFAGEIRC
jgi:hypothetical protein